MVLPGKALSDWAADDLQRLVDLHVQESDTLEYKREMYGGAEKDTREMLRDVVSMANYRGGHIVIGIDEDDDGAAVQLIGVDKDDHVERITSSCLANIERRLNGLEVEDVELGTGKVAVVIKVPQSLGAPHMVTFKGLNQYWKRHGRQKDKMSVDELQEAFDRATQAATLVERFIAERKRRLWERIVTVPWILVTATPLFTRQEIVDTRDSATRWILDEKPEHPVCRSVLFLWQFVAPSLHGLRGEGMGDDGLIDYIELHRNGHLELGSRWPFEHENGGSISSRLCVCYVDRFLQMAAALWDHLGLVVPLAFTVTLFNARGLNLAFPPNTEMAYRLRKKPFTDDRHLEFPILYVEDIVRDHKTLLKTASDRLWNAFGLEVCDLLTETGEWQ